MKNWPSIRKIRSNDGLYAVVSGGQGVVFTTWHHSIIMETITLIRTHVTTMSTAACLNVTSTSQSGSI